jgi:hypothetical protein
MSELSSKFNIETFDFHAKLTFVDLEKENITSEEFYLWSAPIDLIEHYQFYLNQLSTFNDSILSNKIFYNCTWPRFGPQCQYEFSNHRPDHLSSYDIIHHFYKTIEYNPINLTCYEHLQCKHHLLPVCLDWTEICNGQIDCFDDQIDEQDCFQLEINECSYDEYRCRNGQCIPQSFHVDNFQYYYPDCLDGSDEPIASSRASYIICPTNEPSFRCEDLTCIDTPLTSSCIKKRQDLLYEAIHSNKSNSTSEECWLPSKCILEFTNLDKIICENLCAKNACINAILNTCPDILYIPNTPLLFGNIYFAYKKGVRQNSTNGNIWLFYICYTNSHYDAFFDMISKISLDNRTCFFYKTISYSSIQSRIESKHLRFLEEISKKFQKYNLIFNYNSTICNRSSMYQCMNSTKCISLYRLLDKIDDCPYMDDENITAINNTHAGKQLDKTHFKCQITNKYIHRSLFKDNICDCGRISGWCEDEDRYLFNSYKNISFQTICDGFKELIPIIDNEQNQTDETECQQWECDNIYTHCNGIWNCLNGKDEINCNLSKCPKDHHLCVSPYTNQFMCLPIGKINDGKVDCLGASDEIILCRTEYESIQPFNFYCMNQTSRPCIADFNFCNGINDCNYGDDEQFCEKNRIIPLNEICTYYSLSFESDIEKLLCDQMGNYKKAVNTYFTLDGMSKSIAYKTKNTDNIVLSSSSNAEISTDQHYSHCQRGLNVRVWSNKTSPTNACFCPPSYYGSKCQYQNQRISLTIRFRALSDSYQIPFAIMISLIDDSNERIIHSYEQITYSSVSHCKTKFNIYLLYATRPKDSRKHYTIHIDFYEKISLAYRGSVLLPINFPFLPVHRLSFIVDVPQNNDNKTQICSNVQCNHGKCIKYSTNPDNSIFCQCNPGWSGQYCTIKYTCNCASISECLGVSASNRSICVCPINKFGSRCLLKNTICKNNSICENGGQCIGNDEYLVSKQNLTCLCRKGFRGDRCEIVDTKLILSFDKNILLTQSIFIHFIQVMTKSEQIRSTTFRTIPFEQDALTISWSRPFHLVFIEPSNNSYYLIVSQTIYNESAIINKTIQRSDRCPNISEVLNETIIQWSLIRRIKYYHLPCQNQLLNLSCFHDDVHICLCYDFGQQRLSNCFNFDHKMEFNCQGQSVCGKDGKCLQDIPDCPTRSICICNSCFYGRRCQFSTHGFGLSLDSILGYHILPSVSLNHQPFIIKMSLSLTIIFLIGGLVDSILSIMTFKNKVVRDVGCGLYLLGSSITTLLTMIMFGLKFIILLLAQMTIISNRSFLSMQCYSIDFLLRIGLSMDQWLNACVATERAFTVIKGAKFSKKKSKLAAKFVIILLVIIIVGTSIHDPISRGLIDEESNDDDDNVKRTWCIVNYGSVLQVYNSMINTIHFLGPFLINLISSIILITKKSRQQAKIHKQRPYKEILIEQFKENKHLLTAPIVLVILAFPRLIITFVSKCMKSSNDSWLFLTGYFISFVPPMLTFIVFILPSTFYKKEFRKSIVGFRMTIQRRLRLTS